MLKTLIMKAAIVAFLGSISFAAFAVADTQRFDVPAGELAAALESLAKQANVDLVYQEKQVKGLRTKGVSGNFSAHEAVTKLLEGTPMQLRLDEASGAILIATPTPIGPATTPGSSSDNSSPRSGEEGARDSGKVRETRLAQASEPDRDSETANESESQALPSPNETGKAIPEVLVRGSKILNMDIPRSRDDTQPYVVFSKEAIEKSGANSINDFLKNRLTMNTEGISDLQRGSSFGGPRSRINLRGLGTNQTLILVDGHRAAGVNAQGTPAQPDLDGIPLSAIERIEVLPATASGIYGGGATGGVINIVLRRDYAGVETKITYDNSFKGDSPVAKIDLGAGFNFENGRTNLLLGGSYSDSEQLLAKEREFFDRFRATVMANNPGFFLNAANPPFGATTNIRSVNGSNLVLTNGTQLNSPVTHVPAGYPGTSTDGGAALAANAGTYNLELPNNTIGQNGALFPLLMAETLSSAMVTLRREFTPSLQMFIEGGAADHKQEFSRVNTGIASFFTIPAGAPNNPFTQAIRVRVPSAATDDSISNAFSETATRRVVGGVIFKLWKQWQAEADYTWNRTSSTYNSGPASFDAALNAAVANGSVDVLQDAQPLDFSSYMGGADLSFSPWRFTMKDAVVRLAGPVWTLPGGPVNLSALIERREEILGETLRANFNPGVNRIIPEQTQSVNSAYLEFRAPLFSAANSVPGIQEFDLQVAARRDNYTTEGGLAYLSNSPPPSVTSASNEVSSTDFTFAVRYSPIADLTLRASYGTGFLPPAVDQLVPAAPIPQSGGVVDPRRGNEVLGSWQNTLGGNPDLEPEDSTSWSAGVILSPRFVAGLRLSVDYTRVEKEQNIATFPGGIQALVNNESLFPGRITRAPVPPNDPFGVGPIIAIDQTLLNIAAAEVEAYDVQLDQHIETTAAGSFDLFALATWQTHYKTQVLAGQPVVENVGVGSSSPLHFKANFGATWNRTNWSIGWSARYFDSYMVANPAQPFNVPAILNQGNGGRIPSQIYHDVFMSYSFEGDAGPNLLENLGVRIGARNVFDEEPPVDVNAIPILYSPFGDPRLATYYISLRKSF